MVGIGRQREGHRWGKPRGAHPDAPSERGEGVVSAAIAVLVMAGIGAMMWVGLQAIWEQAEDATRDKVSEIGE